MPFIPPLQINDKLISDFEVKANHFSNFFSSQCTPLDNSSKTPESQTYIKNTKLSSFNFENRDIGKVHGHDNISIRMLKICDSAIAEPLSILLNNCMNQSMFPDIWKRWNICPIHKKGDSQIISNYRPVSLLLICGKIFERLIFNSLYEYVEENKLLSGINLVFGLTIHVYISYHQLIIIYAKFFMLTQLLKLVVCFQICLRLLTKSAAKD